MVICPEFPETIVAKRIPDLLQSERCTEMKILVEATTLDASLHPMRTTQPSTARPAWRSPKLGMLDTAETLGGIDTGPEGGLYS